MSQRYFLAIITVLVGTSGLFAWLKQSPTTQKADATSSISQAGTRTQTAAGNAAANTDQQAALGQRQPASESAAPAQVELLDYKSSPALARFDALKQKVFLTETERREKMKILKDDALLRSLKELLLRNSSLDRTLQADQDRALDLLYEAIENDQNPAAFEVLRAIVADDQIEKTAMDSQARENLAGIKGEVIYQWIALHPNQAQDVESLLPGPVSRQIWQNVKRLQDINHAESRSEFAGSY